MSTDQRHLEPVPADAAPSDSLHLEAEGAAGAALGSEDAASRSAGSEPAVAPRPRKRPFVFDWLDSARWAWWTAAHWGWRHARRGAKAYPQQEHETLYERPAGPLGELAAFLREQAGLAGLETAERREGDVAAAAAALTAVLGERGLPVSRLPEPVREELVVLLAEAARARVAERDAVPVSQAEAQMLRICERQTDELLERWSVRSQVLQTRAKRLAHELADLAAEYREHRAAHQAKGLRPVDTPISKWLYVPALLSLGALELPFNLNAFQVLRAPREETLLIALGPCLATILLAHVLGSVLRQAAWPPWMKTLTCVAGAAGSLLATVAAVAWLRFQFLSYASGSGAEIELLSSGAAMAALNLLFLAAGTLLAFFTHDPDRSLELTIKARRRVRRRLSRAWRRWGALAERHDAERGRVLARIDRCRDHALQCAHEYREANEHYRHDESRPSSFGGALDHALFRPRVVAGELDRAFSSLEAEIGHLLDEPGSEPRGSADDDGDDA